MSPAAKPADTRFSSGLTIGFVGHRFLRESGNVRATIVNQLKELRESAGGKPLLAISSTAIGADMLFAQAALETKIPLQVYLPFPEAEFRKDFSEQDWLRAKKILEQAASITCGPAPSAGESSAAARRALAYAECARRIVDASDILIAVWDGKPARGRGGAQESIAYAKTLGKRLIIINAT